MIALLRIDTMTTRNDVEVPDINAPGDWYGFPAGLGYQMHRNGKALQLDGPHTIPGLPGTYYIADMPRAWLSTVQSWLGGPSRANSLRKALNNSAAVRQWAKATFRIVRNSSNQPIAVAARNVICGSDPVDLDLGEDETADDLPVMVDLD